MVQRATLPFNVQGYGTFHDLIPPGPVERYRLEVPDEDEDFDENEGLENPRLYTGPIQPQDELNLAPIFAIVDQEFRTVFGGMKRSLELAYSDDNGWGALSHINSSTYANAPRLFDAEEIHLFSGMFARVSYAKASLFSLAKLVVHVVAGTVFVAIVGATLGKVPEINAMAKRQWLRAAVSGSSTLLALVGTIAPKTAAYINLVVVTVAALSDVPQDAINLLRQAYERNQNALYNACQELVHNNQDEFNRFVLPVLNYIDQNHGGVHTAADFIALLDGAL